jgi:hypothetical protein
MKSDRELQAEIKANIRAVKDRDFAAAHNGAVMLDDLWHRLQSFQRDYDVYIDQGPRGRPKSIEIRRDLRADPVALWTRDGSKLHFASASGTAEAATIEEAVAITLQFLEGAPGAVAKPANRLGFLP